MMSASPPKTFGSVEEPLPRKILFLDDDRGRADLFLAEYPDAVWVETVESCLLQLEQAWDEVHLDHDLGGERFVDLGRDDCGMAIVRWLCAEPRPHLLRTSFFVHSHNNNAALVMCMQLKISGYQAECRPFGGEGWRRQKGGGTPRAALSQAREWLAALGRLFRAR